MSTTLQSIAERAQRQLDGMAVNHDAFARDVLRLVQAVRQAQQVTGPASAQPTGSGFADAFGSIFDDIFKTKGGH